MRRTQPYTDLLSDNSRDMAVSRATAFGDVQSFKISGARGATFDLEEEP
jgi:hypothetical protein